MKKVKISTKGKNSVVKKTTTKPTSTKNVSKKKSVTPKVTTKTRSSNNKKKKINIKNGIMSFILMGGILFVSLILVFALYIIISSPEFDKNKLYSKESTIIYYKDGTELTRLGQQNRDLVNYDEIPQVLIDAFIATEDSRFFQHKGLDVARFAKASIGQLLGNNSAGGASTITMQVVKKTYTDPHGKDTHGLRGIIRKFTDIYMAVFKLESCYTKEEIIEFYANSMWFGNDGSVNYDGIAGVEQASKHFFGKSVSDITLAEASILAGMYQNPAIYNPFTSPDRVKQRQRIVLKLMVNHGYITEEEKEVVEDIPIQMLVRDKKNNKSYPNQAVIDYVRNVVTKETGLNPFNIPMKIYTTIDKNVQNSLTRLENGELYKFPNEKIQEGIAITSVKDGSITGLSGGRNYQAKGLNRATGVKRQPGSTAKPIYDYGPYLEYLNGSTYSMLLDEPTTYSNGTPIKNAEGKYYGLITLREALYNSRNIPALRVFKELQQKKKGAIGKFVNKLGIDYGETLYESASIGGAGEVTPLEMSAAYGAFARGGNYIKPYVYTKIIINENGKVYEYKYEKEKAMSKETAYMITDILITATKHNVGGGIKISGTDIATKTGTTTIDAQKRKELGLSASSVNDAWTIAMSPDYVISLWAGYDVLTKEYHMENTECIRIRNGIMKPVATAVFPKNHRFKKPGSVIPVEVELETFPPQLPSEFTPANMKVTELFKAGTEPTEVSTRYSKLDKPTNGNYKNVLNTITLTWDGIKTPDAINTGYLQEHFNKYYDNVANKYYEQRMKYNDANIGYLQYNIYQKNPDGSLKLIDTTTNNSYTVHNVLTSNPTFIIKSAYSIFSYNMSNGLEIKVDYNFPSFPDIKPDNNDKPEDDNKPLFPIFPKPGDDEDEENNELE